MLLSVLAAAASLAPAHVSAGDLLVVDNSSHVRIVHRSGKLVRRLRWTLPTQGLQSIELTGDRTHAFVSIQRSELPPQLFDVELATGRKRRLANAISPALSPDKTRLAYVTVGVRSEIKYRTALVIRNVRTGRTRSVPLARNAPLGTPPELVTNWSPDSRQVALFDGSRIALVDVRHAADVPSEPTLPSDGPPILAPVFLDRKTVVGLADCCIGSQRLLTVDVDTGRRAVFAILSSPPEQVRRIGVRRLLVVTALRELAVVTSGRVHVIARGIAAASP